MCDDEGREGGREGRRGGGREIESTCMHVSEREKKADVKGTPERCVSE
jgi:hypothetical protein